MVYQLSSEELANNYLSERYMELLCKRSANDLFQFKGVKEADMDEVERWILSLLKRKNNLQRALKSGIYFKRIIDPDIWNDQIRRKKIRRR
ncbi:hypothetical protein H5410_014319 [Solanum commersonii]|uniref:Uncharacterized protein n=1 Tax=Solanum commersonii TaxID=4109 RepID=A0A9J5ZR32_SOLCO|nr:hypothetical protein H5410_014319 [Solanum commersonii]